MEGFEHWEDFKQKGLKPIIPKLGFVILVLGLGTETLFQTLIGNRDTQFRVDAQNRLGQEQVKAANILRTIKRRDLSIEDQASLAQELKSFAGETANITVCMCDFEAGWFATQVAAVLKAASWNVVGPTAIPDLEAAVSGIRIDSTADEKSRRAVQTLLTALHNRNFGAGTTGAILIGPETVNLRFGAKPDRPEGK